MTTMTKTEKIIFGSIGSITLIMLLFSFIFGNSIQEDKYQKQYKETISVNDSNERELSEKFTEAAKSVGVNFKNTFIIYDKRGNPSSFVYCFDGEYDSISIKNIDLTKSFQFIPEYFEFKNL